MECSDRFVLSVISLAFALKRLVDSDYYDEGKDRLVQDFIRLKNRVQLHTRILEDRRTARNFQQNSSA